MRSEWRIRPLGDVVDNHDSQRIPVKRPDRAPGPFPYYGASGVVDYVDQFIFDGEFLLIAEDGENLRTRKSPIAFIAKGKFWVNNHAHILKGNSAADTHYLMYSLACANISGFLTGSTMPKLTQRALHCIPMPVPPIDEQRRIAGVLGALDDKIELNRRMNQTLEAMVQALFKSWFIDFDGVPTSDRVESELGPIPKGWSIGVVADMAELNPSVWRKKGAPGHIKYLDLKAVKRGTISNYTEYRYADAPSRARRILRHGDTIIGTVRPANGSFCLIQTPPPLATGSTGFAVD